MQGNKILLIIHKIPLRNIIHLHSPGMHISYSPLPGPLPPLSMKESKCSALSVCISVNSGALILATTRLVCPLLLPSTANISSYNELSIPIFVLTSAPPRFSFSLLLPLLLLHVPAAFQHSVQAFEEKALSYPQRREGRGGTRSFGQEFECI